MFEGWPKCRAYPQIHPPATGSPRGLKRRFFVETIDALPHKRFSRFEAVIFEFVGSFLLIPRKCGL
jgi:hypothetical protein